jgi:hypothetical protein
MNRMCRKCGEYIPNRIKINGKYKSLQNRKFCLKCSPYKGHNTKPDDPTRPAIKKGSYANWSDEAKKRNRNNVYKRGRERKAKLVAISGGKCIKCGYCKSLNALVFHHKDPSLKKFGLSQNNLWSTKWEIILEEYAKCELYCQNCHTEIHDEINNKDPNYYKNVFKIG